MVCFRIRFCIPLLDTVISETEQRFSGLTNIAIKLLNLSPSTFMSINEVPLLESLAETINLYKDDLPNPKMVKTEMILYKGMLEGMKLEGSYPGTLLESANILFIHQHTFPNILRMVQLTLVLPVTSCEAERSFSALRRLYN